MFLLSLPSSSEFKLSMFLKKEFFIFPKTFLLLNNCSGPPSAVVHTTSSDVCPNIRLAAPLSMTAHVGIFSVLKSGRSIPIIEKEGPPPNSGLVRSA